MSEESISELIVRVREHKRITIQGGYQCVLLFEKTITRILDTIESQAAELAGYRWIPVGETPKHGGKYLALHDGGYVCSALFYPEDLNGPDQWDSQQKKLRITHYMPLLLKPESD